MDSTVRLNIGFERATWRELRRLAEECKGNGRTSVSGIVRELVSAELSKREGEKRSRPPAAAGE